MTTLLDTKHRNPPHEHVHGPKPEALPRFKPISVNGVTIPQAEIARETQHHPAAKPIDAWMAAARALVVRELLLQEAGRLELKPVPGTDAEGRRETDDEALVRTLMEHQVLTPEPDEATCRRVYDQKRATFRSSDLYAVRHILISAAPGDAAARGAALARAKAIIAEVQADPAIFGHLAASASACPSGANGGQLGQISRGQTVPEFEAALADAPVGEVFAEPIETRYGFHVIILDQKLLGQELPFEMVRESIARWLSTRSHQIAVRQYIAMLAGRATIAGVTLDASSSQLVQ